MPYYNSDEGSLNPPAIVDTKTSPMEDLTNAEQAFVDANDKLTKEIIPCTLELLQAWDEFEIVFGPPKKIENKKKNSTDGDDRKPRKRWYKMALSPITQFQYIFFLNSPKC